MPGQRSQEEILAEMVLDEIKKRAKGVAAMMGPPPDSEAVGPQKELAMWNHRDTTVDPVALVQQGVTPEEATLRAYPYRGPMLLAAGSEDQPEERIAYAKRMKRMSEGQAEEEEPAMEGGYANAIDIG